MEFVAKEEEQHGVVANLDHECMSAKFGSRQFHCGKVGSNTDLLADHIGRSTEEKDSGNKTNRLLFHRDFWIHSHTSQATVQLEK